MSFKEPNFEKGREEIEGNKKLDNFLELTALKLNSEGIPVDNKCRISMDFFSEVYPKEVVEEDKQIIEELRKKFYGKLAEQIENEGEELEKLKTAIFQKNLGTEFTVVRSSHYDDIKNGVDNVILDKNGNLVCALDEVGDISGEIYEKKKRKVLIKNIKENGVSLKYGFILEKQEDKLNLKLGNIDNLPIFYLALPVNYIEEGINNFSSNPEESSSYEKKLFAYFIASMNFQIKELKLNEHQLHPKLKERLCIFEKFLKNFT